MADIQRTLTEAPSIDVVLVTLKVGEADEIGLDTSNKIAVEPMIETTAAVTLIIKGILKAQKLEMNTVIGNTIKLTDNVFNAEMAVILQGGVVVYDAVETQKMVSYTPPVIGGASAGEIFILSAYTAQYNTAGVIVRYEKITYPNCVGIPVSLSSEDGAFRAPEYKILSAPATGVAPYVIEYIDVEDMPTLIDTPAI